MPNLTIRAHDTELMDLPTAGEIETRHALREIDAINRLLGGYSVIFDALEKLHWTDKTMTIVDLGSGGGDMLRAISDWALHHKRHVNLIGIDYNPVMTNYAREQSVVFPNIHFRTMNVLDERLMDERADVIINSLFCHHFDQEQLVTLVQRMHALAAQAVIINDIHRHWFAYYSIKALTWLFSRNPLVRYDAALSVARSLTRKEWQAVLKAAGIENYTLRWMWAFRWQIIIRK
ncbi:MAG: methyltransferase domain-containing protein [Bacteroidetes bacterium]|nr:methyltransferase domain-containing protein [Bacteroidota bacterium]